VPPPDEPEGCDCQPVGKSLAWRLICSARALSLAAVPPPAVNEEVVVDDDPELLVPHADPTTASARATIGIRIPGTERPPWTRTTSGQHIEGVTPLRGSDGDDDRPLNSPWS
jgi:hypothetical protein